MDYPDREVIYSKTYGEKGILLKKEQTDYKKYPHQGDAEVFKGYSIILSKRRKIP